MQASVQLATRLGDLKLVMDVLNRESQAKAEASGEAAKQTAEEVTEVLSVACDAGRVDIATALLEHKADPDVVLTRWSNGRPGYKTPVEIAMDTDNTAMVALLIEHKAALNTSVEEDGKDYTLLKRAKSEEMKNLLMSVCDDFIAVVRVR